MKQKKCKKCKGKGYGPVYFEMASRARGIEECPVCKGSGKVEIGDKKAGKDMNVATKWHDLLKNPTDVPKENVTVLLLTEVEPVTARYDNEYEAFFRLNDKLDYCVFIAPMGYIAWCEIPEYTEE